MGKEVDKKMAMLDSAEMKRVNGGTNLISLPITGPIIGVVIANEFFNKMKGE